MYTMTRFIRSTTIYTYLHNIYFSTSLGAIKSSLLLLGRYYFHLGPTEMLLKSIGHIISYLLRFIIFLYLSLKPLRELSKANQLRITIHSLRNSEYDKNTFLCSSDHKMIFQRLVCSLPLITLHTFIIL